MKRISAPLIKNPTFQRTIFPLFFGVLILVLWQILCMTLEVPTYIVPTPSEIAINLYTNWSSLSHALFVTLKITFFAFIAAVVVGVLVAFLCVQSKMIEASVFPYIILLQVTPIVAIAPLIIIWVKNPTTALSLCAMLVALFPIVSNSILGLRSVNPNLVNLFSINRATRWQVLIKLRVPTALPYFFGGLRISSGLALIGAVVAEFVAGTSGTGSGLAYQILQAGFQLDIPRLFAALFLITVAGLSLFFLMEGLSRLVLRHRTSI